jgi:glucokinase
MGAQPAQIIGIDIGGTKTAIGVVRFPDGKILARHEMTTPQGAASGAAFLGEVCAAASKLRDTTPGITGIGLGICELVDLDGAVSSGHRVKWEGLPALAQLGRVAPATIEADVRAAALAETHWGAGRAYRDLLYLNIGTGISTCWVKDRVPHAGANGHALAIASSPVETGCGGCGTRSAYVLEDVAGGAGLADLYGKAIGRRIASAAEVLEAAEGGEKRAQALLNEAAHLLGTSLGLAVNILDPQALLIGGGIGARAGFYWDAMERAIRKQIWSARARKLPILRAGLGAESGLIGAAASHWLRAAS